MDEPYFVMPIWLEYSIFKKIKKRGGDGVYLKEESVIKTFRKMAMWPI